MTPQEQIQKIKEITDVAIAELETLGTEHHAIIRAYIKELEVKKIETIRKHILETEK